LPGRTSFTAQPTAVTRLSFGARVPVAATHPSLPRTVLIAAPAHFAPRAMLSAARVGPQTLRQQTFRIVRPIVRRGRLDQPKPVSPPPLAVTRVTDPARRLAADPGVRQLPPAPAGASLNGRLETLPSD